jgi:adenylate kinase
MRLIFFGPPGVGKGTQSKLISNRLQIPQISTGELLRAAAKEDSPRGREIETYLAAGQLVPDQMIIDIIRTVLDGRDMRNGFILDGFPRTQPQAENLDRMFRDLQVSLSSVIEIKVPGETIVERLVNRRICSNCGAEYNLLFNPIPASGSCDKCGNRTFIHRSDDNEETIRKRLEIYKRNTAPVLDYYAARGKLFQVDGDREITTVNAEIVDHLLAVSAAE